jgi:hypothetical protein
MLGTREYGSIEPMLAMLLRPQGPAVGGNREPNRPPSAGTRLNSTCPGRAGQDNSLGYHAAIPLTVAFSAISATTGQEQHRAA